LHWPKQLQHKQDTHPAGWDIWLSSTLEQEQQQQIGSLSSPVDTLKPWGGLTSDCMKGMGLH
jgi:hypothetical protein